MIKLFLFVQNLYFSNLLFEYFSLILMYVFLEPPYSKMYLYYIIIFVLVLHGVVLTLVPSFVACCSARLSMTFVL